MQLRFFTALCCCLVSLSLASAEAPPVPGEKPIGEGQSVPFVEGADAPRSKPASTPSGELASKEVRKERPICQLPHAQFETEDPFKGGGGFGPMDDAECGISDPVALKGLAKDEMTITFPGSVLLSCDFAAVVTAWLLQDVADAAATHMGSALAHVGSGPGFQCRRRNNQPDGKLSEHALGKALDIAHFSFRDGTTATIAQDWAADTKEGRFLQAVHKSACQRFTTVLGPDADESHKSHLHLDIGCHGQDCTYLICQ